MITLFKLLDEELLAEMVNAGYVKAQTHPELPIAILNYTARAQYDRVWNDVTRRCRGLIYDMETQEILARPWPKFFNYGEHEHPVTYDLSTHRKVYPESDTLHKLDIEAPVHVTDKMDGSLGILYPSTDGWAIATRGSFTSEQAIRATLHLRRTYSDWQPEEGITYLFEIIYPENRIVVDYKGLEDLVMLGRVHTDTGTVHEPPLDWPGPVVQSFECTTLAGALAIEPRENAEGLVVRFLETGQMVKIKQDDYVALHKLVTGLNERTVWEYLRENWTRTAGRVDELLDRLPDEFHAWVKEIAGELTEKHFTAWANAQTEYKRILAELHPYSRPEAPGWYELAAKNGYPEARDYRKDFAAHASKTADPGLMFALLDRKTIDDALWKTLKPDITRTLLAITEDNA